MNEKHGSNGFLMGLLIGSAVGALVSSKKGRKILKDLADYGLEYVGNTINLEDIETILNEDEEEMMSGELTTEEGVVADEKPSTSIKKRLFKGIRKK